MTLTHMRAARRCSLVVSLALGLLALGWAKAQAPDPKGEDAKPPQQRKVMLAFSGYIVPVRHVRIVARARGEVRQVFVEEGGQVQAGAALARIEATAYELEVKRRSAEVERERARLADEMSEADQRQFRVRQAEAAVQQAAAQLAYHKAEVARLRSLAKAAVVGVDAVSEKEAQLRVAETKVLQAESGLKIVQLSSRNERVAAARAALGIAEARLELARFQLAGTEVRTPITGTIVAKHIQVGDAANPDAGRAVLFEIADLSLVEARVRVPEGDLAKVSAGQKCEIRLPALGGALYRGVVTRVLPMIDVQTATAQAYVLLEPAGKPPRPGMRAEVRFLTAE
jgi:multidrug resistance efflux pump